MSDIKIKKCSFCAYLNKYDKEFIKNINNSIVIGTKYKDILEMFNDSKMLNDLQKPSKHFMEKHRSDCLKDFKPIIKTVSNLENDDKYRFDYTDYTDKKTIEVKKTLKEKLLYISAKLVDHIEHELLDFSKSKPNVKETVATLKTTIDLMNFDVGRDEGDSEANFSKIFLNVRGEESKMYQDIGTGKIYDKEFLENVKDKKEL
tara:strand:+ start:2476 stop:3084 length:609 start_codon:yes stop_codon:yes gene_type:complete